MTIDYLEIVDQIEAGDIMALSILQPYPHHIFHDGKDVENRSWPTSYRGWVIVHTGKKDIYVRGIDRFNGLKRGGYVGMMRITNCVKSWRSKWFFGPYGFTVEDAFELPFFIPGPGAQGFFRPAPPFMAKICQGLRELAREVRS